MIDLAMMIVQKKPVSPLALIFGLSAIFFILFLVVSSIIFMSRSSDHGSGALFNSGSEIAVIELKGVINDSKTMLKKIKNAEDNKQIKGVVLRLDSPGGAVAPSQEIYEAVKRFKKPLVVSMGSVAASGAFYIACGAKKIWANPGTITGSIGVIMEFINLKKLYDWARVQRFSIKTGKFKDSGADYRDMTPEERQLLQGMVDNVLVQFKQAVSEGRKIPMSQLDPIADGRIFSGVLAKQAHLVDELGGIDDAIKDVAKMANIKGEPKVIYPGVRHKHWLDLLLNADRDRDDDSRAADFSLVSLLRRFVMDVGFGNPGSVDGESARLPSISPGIYWIWNGGA